MLPKDSRLPRLEFPLIKKSGKMFYGKHLSILVLRNGADSPPRFGMIVSTKISKKAVVRNKIRRFLKRSIVTSLDRIAKGTDILILVRPGVLGLNYSDVELELQTVLSKSGLFR